MIIGKTYCGKTIKNNHSRELKKKYYWHLVGITNLIILSAAH